MSKQGRIVAVTGTMKSGKSTWAIRHALKAVDAGKKVQAFRPEADTRDDKAELRSRNGIQFPATRLSHAGNALSLISTEADVVIFDEVNMLPGVIDTLLICRRRGIEAVAIGLQLKWDGTPFPPMPDLLCYADEVIVVRDAKCDACGDPACYNTRVVELEEDIVPGDGDIYAVRCARCFHRERNT